MQSEIAFVSVDCFLSFFTLAVVLNMLANIHRSDFCGKKCLFFCNKYGWETGWPRNKKTLYECLLKGALSLYLCEWKIAFGCSVCLLFHGTLLFRHRKLIFMIISFIQKKKNELWPVEKSIDRCMVQFTHSWINQLRNEWSPIFIHASSINAKHLWFERNTYCNFIELITDYHVLFAMGNFFFRLIRMFLRWILIFLSINRYIHSRRIIHDAIHIFKCERGTCIKWVYEIMNKRVFWNFIPDERFLCLFFQILIIWFMPLQLD